MSWELKVGAQPFTEGCKPHIQALAIGGKELPPHNPPGHGSFCEWVSKGSALKARGLDIPKGLQRSCGGSFDPGWDLMLRRGNSYFLSPLDFLGGHDTEFSSMTVVRAQVS